MHIKKVVLNGQNIPDKDLGNILKSLTDNKLLIKKGGFLFKAHVTNDKIKLGIIPNFEHGERKYHSDINISSKTEVILTGFINKNRTISILAEFPGKKKQMKLPETQKKEAINKFIQFAVFLVERDFEKDFAIDELTQQVVLSLGGTLLPQTIKELAELK